MTEAEWRDAEEVGSLIARLRIRGSRWRWSTRLSRLFGCGCARRVWYVLTEPAQRGAVESAEAVADKRIRLADLKPIHAAVVPIHLGNDPSDARPGWGQFLGSISRGGWPFWVQFNQDGDHFCSPGGNAAHPTPWGNPYRTANDARALLHFRKSQKKARAEEKLQCDLLRDLVGPLSPPTLKDAWLTPNDRAVPRLAGAIYEERAFDRLAILADALEDAGCNERVLLDHLRAPGPHARGCWAVDLILGKS
jgi:hypothetical protein